MRLGIIGCGYVTFDRHLPALERVPDVEVVAFADADPERAAAAAREVRAARAVGVEDLLASEVEAVAVCTPPATHSELALAALVAGKHLFLEKPVAPSLEEVDRIADQAARSACQVLVGFNFRRHRLVERARQVVGEGLLGRVQTLRTAFTGPVLDHKVGWKLTREAGGGALMDRAIHHFDLWRFVLGVEVTEVFALSRSEEGDDQSVVISGRTTSGTPVSALALDDSAITHELAVYGSDAVLFVDCCRFDGFHVARRTEPPGSPTARLHRAGEALNRPGESYRAIRSGGDFRVSYIEQWRHFARVVRGEVLPSPTLADGRAALEIALAAARSADCGSSAQVGERA